MNGWLNTACLEDSSPVGLEPTSLEVKEDGEAIITSRDENVNILKYLRSVVGTTW